MTGPGQPQTRLTLKCIQESAMQSGCFLLVNFVYMYPQDLYTLSLLKIDMKILKYCYSFFICITDDSQRLQLELRGATAACFWLTACLSFLRDTTK